MSKLATYLNRNTDFSFTDENIDFICDIFNSHGYLLTIKEDMLYRINEEDPNEPEEPYDYEEIYSFIVEAVDEFEDLSEQEEAILNQKIDRLPDPYEN